MKKKLNILSFINVLAEVFFYALVGKAAISVGAYFLWIYLHLSGVVNMPLGMPPEMRIHLFSKTSIVAVLYVFFAFFLAWHVRRFMKNIAGQLYFADETIRHLRLTGFGLIGWGIARGVMYTGMFSYWGNRSWDVCIVRTVSDFKFALIGILVLGIAHAFIHGRKLHDENSLTV